MVNINVVRNDDNEEITVILKGAIFENWLFRGDCFGDNIQEVLKQGKAESRR